MRLILRLGKYNNCEQNSLFKGQFPTRQLPSKYQTLPFFQSYICTIDNKCMNATEYEETSKFENAPLVVFPFSNSKMNKFYERFIHRVTPLLNIMQIFINEPILMEAVTNLPKEKNFVGAVTKVYTHKKFKNLQHYINLMNDKVPLFMELVGTSFDIKHLWSGRLKIDFQCLFCERYSLIC